MYYSFLFDESTPRYKGPKNTITNLRSELE